MRNGGSIHKIPKVGELPGWRTHHTPGRWHTPTPPNRSPCTKDPLRPRSGISLSGWSSVSFIIYFFSYKLVNVFWVLWAALADNGIQGGRGHGPSICTQSDSRAVRQSDGSCRNSRPATCRWHVKLRGPVLWSWPWTRGIWPCFQIDSVRTEVVTGYLVGVTKNCLGRGAGAHTSDDRKCQNWSLLCPHKGETQEEESCSFFQYKGNHTLCICIHTYILCVWLFPFKIVFRA